MAYRHEMEVVIAMLREMQIDFARIRMASGLERGRSWAVKVVNEKIQAGMRQMKMQG